MDIDNNRHNGFMVRVLNKYELIRNGRRLEVYLKYDEYDNLSFASKY